MIPSTLVSIVLFIKFVVIKDFMPSPELLNLYSPKPYTEIKLDLDEIIVYLHYE